MNTDHFKDTLTEEKKLVEKELHELGWKNKETGEWETTGDTMDVTTPMQDANEAGDQIEELEERQSETVALEARLKDIQDALIKIDKGTYGVCEVSGDQIEEDRLEANPAARTCKAHTA